MHKSHEEFVKVFLRNQHRIYRFIQTLVPNLHDAEELFQEVSLTLWRRWEEFDATLPFVPWALGMARNHVRNHVRKRISRGPSLQLSDQTLERLADLRMKADERLEERASALHDCLDRLSAGQKKLLGEFYQGGCSAEELATGSGTSANAIYKTLQRIRASLFDCLNRFEAATGKGGGA
jgi:RNA polymerase sigma-70 factor (ECF subfamily)